MTPQLSLPIEIETKANTPSKPSPVASKDIKTMNHATQHRTIAKNDKISRTRWTDKQWRDKYFETTREHPKDLIRRARERDDVKTVVFVDNILNGYYRDNRKRNKRTEEDLITEGNWYYLYMLAKAMREGKR